MNRPLSGLGCLLGCLLLVSTSMAQLPLRVRKTAPTSSTTGAPSAGPSVGVQEPQLTPLAPNAAAMARYGEVQVNSNTGQISPSVPLYEIKLNDFTLPISLNYSGGGLKPSDVTGWVGLGWSINAMGTISRQVRSIPDEQTYGYNGGNPTGQVVERMTKDIFPGYLGLTKDQFKIGCAQYQYDSEPDMFYYSFGAYGGSFYFDHLQATSSSAKVATTIPRNDLNIVATFNSAAQVIYNASNKTGAITKFTVNDPQGVIYEFDVSDGSVWATIDDETKYGINRYNTWYLHKITTPNGNVIEFVYKYRKLTHPAVFAQRAEIPLAIIPNIPLDPVLSLVHGAQSEVIDYYLDQIKVNDGKDGTIRFIEQTAERSDWSFSNPDPNGNRKPHALDKVSIENGEGTIIKEYTFAYVASANRLLLQSVTEQNGTVSMPPYTFSYFDAPSIPPYYSLTNQTFQEDYWGYLNNCSGNCNLLVPTYTYQPQNSPLVVSITGDNKQPSLTTTQIGQLSSIQYPTKGYTYFDYELNEYQDYSTNPNICTGPYTEAGRATALMSNYNGGIGGVFSEVYIPIPQGTSTSQMCIQIDYSITIGGAASQDEVVGAVSLYDASNVAVSQPVILVAKRGQTASASQTIVVRGTQAALAGLRAVAELYAEHYTSDISSNKAEIIVSLNSSGTIGGVLRTAGGLRIKRVKTCPTTTDIGCTVKDYQYLNNDGKSSGQLVAPVLHTYFVNKVSKPVLDNGTYVIQYQGVSSSSQLQTANSSGSQVYYEQVTVKEGGFDNAGTLLYNGSTTENYIPMNSAPDFYYEANAPITLYSPVVSQDWKRGKPASASVSSQAGLLLKKQLTTYSTKNAYENQLIALKTGIATYGQSNLDEYILTPYGLTTGFHYKATESSTDYFYDASNSPGSQTSSTQSTSFTYGGTAHYFLTNAAKQNSKNETVETRLFYPADLTTNTDLGASATNALAKGRKSALLKEEVWTANRLTSTQKTYMNSRGLPSKTIQLFGTSTDGSFTDFIDYDSKGNLAEYALNGGTHVSFIWSYNGAYPVAKVVNATRTQLSGILGNLETVAAATNNATILGYGTSLRTGLASALTTSFTYRYGIGVETETDPKGLTTRYEYDSLGRLLIVKDAKQNVVKSYWYNYK